MSFRRFHEQDNTGNANDAILIDRMAKQVMSCSIRSFGIPASRDPNCVTAYCQNLAEFDMKAQIPSAETDKLYREAIHQFEEKFQTIHTINLLLPKSAE